MENILITGATGNIGQAIIHHIMKVKNKKNIILAARNIEKAKQKFQNNSELSYCHFDFESEATYKIAFKSIDILFLLRPPNLADIDKIFKPLLLAAKKQNIRKVVFLSVQGAEKSSIIPHNKIENLITQIGFEYIFVRPSYFMQNLTTTLLKEIKQKQTITLPSGNAKFNWIDVLDIGEFTSKMITNFNSFKNKAYEVTGSENLNFLEVANLLSTIIGNKIVYKSINPIAFYFRKIKEGLQSNFAIVITILHFVPRLQKAPKISNSFKIIVGKEPIMLRDFIERDIKLFQK
jgi:uncharacterized protein YbjT (DUF2867 family)